VRATLQPADGGQETAHVSISSPATAPSQVRHALGVSFSGDDYPTDFVTADVQVDWKLPRDQHAFSSLPRVCSPFPAAGRTRYPRCR
jgi:hypothetical protein